MRACVNGKRGGDLNTCVVFVCTSNMRGCNVHVEVARGYVQSEHSTFTCRQHVDMRRVDRVSIYSVHIHFFISKERVFFQFLSSACGGCRCQACDATRQGWIMASLVSRVKSRRIVKLKE